MGPFNLGKAERDLGTCLVATCPHCQNLSHFKLRERSAVVKVFGMALIDFDKSYHLFCSLCGFWKDLQDGDLAAAEAARRLHAQVARLELNPAQYLGALDALDFATYRAIREEAAIWRCQVCSEKVPDTLNSCWKCNSLRPGVQDSLPSADEAPPLPHAVTRPSNPWE